MSRKSCVLDASILLHDPHIFQSFHDHDIIIPAVVLEELDRKKTGHDEMAKNARSVMHFIDTLSKQGDIRKGVNLEQGSTMRILLDADHKMSKNFPLSFAPDRIRNRVISLAFGLQEGGDNIYLVSKDPVTKIMAETMGVETQNYKGNKENYQTLHKGITYLPTSKENIDQFYLDGKLPLPAEECHPNQFFILKNEANSSAITRVDAKKKALVPLVKGIQDVWGIKPRNVEQKCALDLLLRDDVKLITFVGGAGTGKTLLALAAGLRKVFDEGVYDRIVISRSIMPLGRDIGFLPGTKDEKLQAWLAPYFDNLDFICSNTKSEAASETKKWILSSDKFQVEAITYMRGRSFCNTYIIIDEAQNLTPHEIKTLISRVGDNTKIVVLGDATQIDNPYLDADSNGLVHLVGRMKHSELFGSIFFQQTERSPLAALAALHL